MRRLSDNKLLTLVLALFFMLIITMTYGCSKKTTAINGSTMKYEKSLTVKTHGNKYPCSYYQIKDKK